MTKGRHHRGVDAEPLPSGQHLALHADAVLSLLARPEPPRRWRAPAFARELALVRAHLSPIHDRALLASSFGREGAHVESDCVSMDRINRRLRVSPVHVAYALRWLELGEEAVPFEVLGRSSLTASAR
jgi:hypothetical protein